MIFSVVVVVSSGRSVVRTGVEVGLGLITGSFAHATKPNMAAAIANRNLKAIEITIPRP